MPKKAKKNKKEKRTSSASSTSGKSSSSKTSKRSKSSTKSGNGSRNGSRRYHALARETLKRETSSTFVSLPAISVREAMKQISMMRPLHDGIPVLKLNSSGKLQKRTLTLSADQMTLFVTHGRVAADTKAAKLKTPVFTPSKGFGKQDSGNYLRYIDVADLESFCVGVISTQTLEDNIKQKMVPSVVTIFHQETFGKTYLNLIIEDSGHRMGLVAALQLMKQTYDEAQQWVSRSVLLMRYIWYDIDKDSNQLISKDEFALICDRINFHISDAKEVYKTFIEENEIEKSELTYGECMSLIEELESTDVVDSIWKRIFGNAPILTAKNFLGFLHDVQGERDNDLNDAKDLISVLNHLEMPPEHALVDVVSKLDKARFSEYLHSPLNDAYNPEHQQWPTQKLNKPLSHYWINTSHNTYLTGDQLRSKSSVEAYSGALRRGCKCLELDCWDGPKASKTGGVLRVDVYHGHTSTSKISFLSILLLVKNYLISNPDSYPIILSLENHCTAPYQGRMAEVLRETLGKKLYIPTAASRKEDMPSPEKLKGKVLIKGKRPPDEDDDEEDSKNIDVSSSMYKADDADLYGKMFDQFDSEGKSDNRLSSLVPDVTNDAKTGKKGKELPKYADSLLELTYFHGAKFKNFEESCVMIPSHMHSIGESKISTVAEKYADSPKLWRQYNMDHMTRTYPAGVRFDSSNYNPIFAWSMGCQMVALNFQTSDTGLIINDGRFRQNGGCGYIPKPKSVMDGEKPEGVAIKIRVLGASCLPKPNGEKVGEKIDPYVQVELHDMRLRRGKEEYYTVSHTTNAVSDNGFCPIWKDDGNQFNVHHNDVAMVVFKIIDQDVVGDDKIACAAIPTKALRQGFRSVQLHNYRNTQIGPFKMATILVHIQQSRQKKEK